MIAESFCVVIFFMPFILFHVRKQKIKRFSLLNLCVNFFQEFKIADLLVHRKGYL